MLYTRMHLVRSMIAVACGLAFTGCGESDAGPAFTASLVYCDNVEAAAPSCSLGGYSLAGDDSALRAKLEGCAADGCHGASSATTWTLDLSGSVQDALSALTTFADRSPYFLVDDLDPDCSQMLSEVTSVPIGVRMPATGNYWTDAETDCFRAYLHELYPQ